MSSDYTLTLEQVYRELRPRADGPLNEYGRRIARRTIDRLIETHGFPRPVSGTSPPVWSKARVRGWIDGAAPDEAAQPAILDPVARDRAALERRLLGAIAKGVA